MSVSSDGRTGVSARAEVFARIRAALADRPVAPPIPRRYATALSAGTDILALFTARVDDYRATVHRTAAGQLPGIIEAVLAERGAERIVVPTGLPEGWLSASQVEPMTDDPPRSHAELDGADGVVTGCAVAIAETGTIVLDGGPGQGRRALSLLPDLHICVVLAGQVVGSVPEALARLEPARPLTWISGPSATSDIELQRVEGVHGPRNLHVILVDEED